MLNRVQFKKGALVFLIIDTIHHDPNFWPDPEVFNPDRYSPLSSVCCALCVEDNLEYAYIIIKETLCINYLQLQQMHETVIVGHS